MTGVCSTSIAVKVPALTVGAVVSIDRKNFPPLYGEVYAADDGGARVRPLGDVQGVVVGSTVTSELARAGTFVGSSLLGCAVDAWGRGDLGARGRVARPDSLRAALGRRSAIRRPLCTHVRAIDGFATLGYGQRIALCAGAGIGKSTLMRRIVEESEVDARVIALIGERGREVAEALDHLRGGRQWNTTTLVHAGADAPPFERLAAATGATAQAEFLASTGRDVLLVFDSLTRVAAAWREVALADGELPAHRGFPPSVNGVLAKLVERAGAFENGSITAVYAVLIDGDDPFEPVTDTLRALLDGQIMLSRRLADAGRYPAIDVLGSLSRTMRQVATERQRRDAALVRRAIDSLERAEDLFAIGAYQAGADPWLDAAVSMRARIEALIFDAEDAEDRADSLGKIAESLRKLAGPHAAAA